MSKHGWRLQRKSFSPTRPENKTSIRFIPIEKLVKRSSMTLSRKLRNLETTLKSRKSRQITSKLLRLFCSCTKHVLGPKMLQNLTGIWYRLMKKGATILWSSLKEKVAELEWIWLVNLLSSTWTICLLVGKKLEACLDNHAVTLSGYGSSAKLSKLTIHLCKIGRPMTCESQS